MKWLETCSILLFLVTFANCSKPRQGKFTFTIKHSEDDLQIVRTGLYRNSSIYMTLRPREGKCPKDESASVCWTARGIDCMAEFTEQNSNLFQKQPWYNFMNRTGMYASNCVNKNDNRDPIKVDCAKPVSHVKYYDRSKWNATDIFEKIPSRRRRQSDPDVQQPMIDNDTPDSDKAVPVNESPQEKQIVKKPEALNLPSDSGNESPQGSKPIMDTKKPEAEKGLITKVPMEGFYHVAVWIQSTEKNDQNLEIDVTLELKNPFQGYLSAIDYPLLTFYMIMCILYAFYAAAWLLMSACHYRDLLRVQFWIGGVILLGMIEKAVFYAEYKNVDDTGISMLGAAKFAEVVSALKRALARMLVIIVSLGFGIVKPRLGPMLHRVIAAGVLFFTLAVVDAFVKHDIEEGSSERKLSFYTFIPLAVVDSIICWWVFISLLQTMKTLRLRRNVVKLALYRHFFNTIILCVIMSVVLVFWSYRSRNEVCIENWQQLWLEPALWHVLFSVILLVIMVLWRPNANNQIYAYSPMIDGNDSDASDEGEPMLSSGATESMKLRSVNRDGSGKDAGAGDQTEADLKWIDENIPQTMADTALPILIDSDDDVRDTKLEMSKIE